MVLLAFVNVSKDEEKSEGERKDDSDSKSGLKCYKGGCLVMGGFRWTSASFSLKSSRVDADTTEDGRVFQSLITDEKKLYL